jgi:hypothetical protein
MLHVRQLLESLSEVTLWVPVNKENFSSNEDQSCSALTSLSCSPEHLAGPRSYLALLVLKAVKIPSFHHS